MPPLEGLTVVALEQAVAAPFATRQLADLGARVIKVERPGSGDFARHYDQTARGLSAYFVWLNRSKESLALDLKHPEAGAILARLLEGADVFIQNLAPGAAARLGFGWEELRSRHPRLIVCDISGYGSTGPYRDKKAYDLLVQCETGMVAVTGTPETPCKVGISIADIAAGMYAYSGILTALYMRERTGRGTRLEVSLFDALAEWMSQPAYFTALGGSPPARTGADHATIAPYGPFEAGDGKQVNIGIQNEREWTQFCRTVLQKPELAGDERFVTNSGRVAHRVELHRAVEEVLVTLTAEELVARLEEANIAFAYMNGVEEFVRHPQLVERGRWCEVDSPAGTLPALHPPVTSEDMRPRMDRIPAVGEDTESILRSLDYDDEAIAGLQAQEAISIGLES